MISTQQAESVSLSGLFQPVLSLLGRLARREPRADDDRADLAEVGRLLETLPLSSDEFSLSSNRLRNAERYFHVSERGAAQWELNMLRHMLQRWLDQ